MRVINRAALALLASISVKTIEALPNPDFATLSAIKDGLDTVERFSSVVYQNLQMAHEKYEAQMAKTNDQTEARLESQGKEMAKLTVTVEQLQKALDENDSKQQLQNLGEELQALKKSTSKKTKSSSGKDWNLSEI